MKALKAIGLFFDRVGCEIQRIKYKKLGIFALIFFILGVFSWIIGGRTDRVTILYIYPRCALPLVYSYILWGFSFAFVGVIFYGIMFTCDRYRRNYSSKIIFFLSVMYLFTLCAHPLFFRALMPFITFLAFLVAIVFCVLALLSSIKISSLWTICISINLVWLAYNAFVALSFSFIN